MFYRVQKSQTSENVLSTLSLQVQGETEQEKKKPSDSMLTQLEVHTFMEQM